MGLMRVIHVSAYYAPAYVYGGPVRSIHALCQAQQAHGLQVKVFTTNAAGSERLAAAPFGTSVEGVRVHAFELSAPAMLLGATDLAPALARAARDVDVVHLHGLFNRTIWDAASVLRRLHKPYVVSPRGMLEPPALAHHRWRKRLTWHLMDRAIVNDAHAVHATSTIEAEGLRDLPVRRVVRIPNPVAVASDLGLNPGEWRRSRGIPADAPIVLALGRLHRIKRLDLVAASFVELKRRVPDAHLVIAGPDEQRLGPELERQLAGVSTAVHFLGQVDGVLKREVIAASTVLVQCSDSESFGMSVAEALAAGRPVVVTRTCPWQEVEEWHCGFWVDQNVTAIADALATIATNDALAREQGTAGRRFVFEKLTPSRVAEAWDAVYHEAAGRELAAA